MGVSGGVWAVSYTHLDVYKRQGCGNVVNLKGFHHFHASERGGKGGGDFLFKAPELSLIHI